MEKGGWSKTQHAQVAAQAAQPFRVKPTKPCLRFGVGEKWGCCGPPAAGLHDMVAYGPRFCGTHCSLCSLLASSVPWRMCHRNATRQRRFSWEGEGTGTVGQHDHAFHGKAKARPLWPLLTSISRGSAGVRLTCPCLPSYSEYCASAAGWRAFRRASPSGASGCVSDPAVLRHPIPTVNGESVTEGKAH